MAGLYPTPINSALKGDKMENDVLTKFEFTCPICDFENKVAVKIPDGARYPVPRFCCANCGVMCTAGTVKENKDESKKSE